MTGGISPLLKLALSWKVDRFCVVLHCIVCAAKQMALSTTSAKPKVYQEDLIVLELEVSAGSNHSLAISVQSAGVRYFDIEGRVECSSIQYDEVGVSASSPAFPVPVEMKLEKMKRPRTTKPRSTISKEHDLDNYKHSSPSRHHSRVFSPQIPI